MSVYSKFKTPFFEVNIASPDWSSNVSLPPEISRLIEKIEIYDSLEVDMHPFASVTFVEGSREPLPATFAASNAIKSSKSSFGNSPGLVTDLIFGSGRNDGKLVVLEKEKSSSRTYQTTYSDPLYLLQNGNIIIIKFGYKEDPKSVRTVAYTIASITIDYPDTNTVVTSVLCQTYESRLNTKVAKNGKTFLVPGKSGDTDTPLSDLIRDIGLKLGATVVVSDTFLSNITADADTAKSIASGESLHQFLSRLAVDNNAYYRIYLNAKTKKNTIVFLARPEYEKATLQSSKLFWFKTPGSIIKSAKISADYVIAQGKAQTGIDVGGNSVDSVSNDPAQENLTTSRNGKKEAYFPSAATGINDVSDFLLERILGQGNVAEGTSDLVPFSNPDEYKTNTAADTANIKNSPITLEMTTLGYPKIIPGVVEIQNLGKRFSGNYRVLNVKHIFDSSGYISQVTASGFFTKDGIVPSEVAETEENSSSESVQLTEKSDNTFTPFRNAISGLSKDILSALGIND